MPHPFRSHYCSEEITVGGYTLPRGTAIFLHGWAMSKDPELWVEPERFNPDRWLHSEWNQGLRIHGREKRKSVEHYKFVPFSMGPRTCPGYSMAKVTLFLQAATLLQCFEWSARDPAVRRVYLATTHTKGYRIVI